MHQKIFLIGMVFKMNIVYKDITQPKLTIAKDWVELKLPLVLSANLQERIVHLAHRIIKDIGPVEQTLRGHFNHSSDGLWISIYSGTKTNKVPRKLFKTFQE